MRLSCQRRWPRGAVARKWSGATPPPAGGTLFWTGVLSVLIGMVMSSAFSGKVSMIAGIFFGLMFGISGIGAAAMGHIADVAGIEQVYRIASFLPKMDKAPR